ncbi:TetR/AcrR family transcriptional regulator [Williamsia sp.]|uniref:TetR/AcrR family transcriptional regulator n=1 Tax=Williamsia sp. TaxID=1872085 RepID=UPI002F949CBC
MTTVAHNGRKAGMRGPDKFEARRIELATATLLTLAELGYARTSLREIAQNSAFSHGVLHYYFADKLDLIAQAVRIYEDVCVTRYDEVIASASTAQELRDEFAEMFFATLESDSALHRLWYDLRNQTLFESSFREDVREIESRREDMTWRVVSRFYELSGVTPGFTSNMAYVIIDGIFQRALMRLLSDGDDQLTSSRDQLAEAFDLFLR